MPHLLVNIPSPPVSQGIALVLHLLCFPGTQENLAIAQSKESGVRTWVLLWQGYQGLSVAQSWRPPLDLPDSPTKHPLGITQTIQPQITLA